MRGPRAVGVQLDLLALARQPRGRQHLLEVAGGGGEVGQDTGSCCSVRLPHYDMKYTG